MIANAWSHVHHIFILFLGQWHPIWVSHFPAFLKCLELCLSKCWWYCLAARMIVGIFHYGAIDSLHFLLQKYKLYNLTNMCVVILFPSSRWRSIYVLYDLSSNQPTQDLSIPSILGQTKGQKEDKHPKLWVLFLVLPWELSLSPIYIFMEQKLDNRFPRSFPLWHL